MDRLKVGGLQILRFPNATTLLDVGCRENGLRAHLPLKMQYFGADLFQNKSGGVDYVGDIMEISFCQSFDLVCAFDVLEHTERPDLLFNKLATIANMGVIVSLPNCYDLQSRLRFLLSGTLGGKLPPIA